jgi:hypothetical protein
VGQTALLNDMQIAFSPNLFDGPRCRAACSLFWCLLDDSALTQMPESSPAACSPEASADYVGLGARRFWARCSDKGVGFFT